MCAITPPVLSSPSSHKAAIAHLQTWRARVRNNYSTNSIFSLQPRSQLPFEILKESRTSSLYSQRRAERTKKDEEHTPLSKFMSRARGLTAKSKAAISAKYTVRGGDNDFDDAVELLPTSSSEDAAFSSHRTSSHLSSRNEPPKDIFDDI